MARLRMRVGLTRQARIAIPARRAAPARLAGLALALSAPPAAAQSPPPPSAPGLRALQTFERELAADVEADSVGSLAAAVFQGDRVVWRGAFGWRDSGDRGAASPATVYR
ncbi:MAG: hypothetical protein P8177_10730, partial [Gemmatimonadota bacterium]